MTFAANHYTSANRLGMNYEVIHIKPLCTKEFCNLYNVTDNTFRKWLAPFKQELGERTGRYYSVLQVEIIFMRLGMPYSFTEGG